MKKIVRLLENQIVKSLEAFPVVYIAGPRQSGKTTLAQRIATTRHPSHYITFDDIQIRASAERDPEFFLKSLEGPTVLDEIQMAPMLFRPLKMKVDENRKREDGGRGQFLLTGSASMMALPTLSDALVGRMVLYVLPPFSVQEILGGRNFIDQIFSKEWAFEKFSEENLIQVMIQASFPELYSFENQLFRNEWCNGYINTILQRDVRALMDVEKIGTLPNLLRLLATRTGGLLNESTLSRETGLTHMTVKRYRWLLESLFLTISIPAWSNNLGKRLIKTPKVYISDLNLLSYLLGIDLNVLPKENSMLFGQILENFVAIELFKQLTFSLLHAQLYYYRTSSGQEVDFILEGPNRQIVGIEVKARSQVTARDFLHLEALKHDLGSKFERGIVFYQGTHVLPFGERMWALPLNALWHSD